MADGIVTIDIDMPLDKFKSDIQLAESLLKGLGDGAGSEMDSDFKKASSNVVSEAKDVKKDVDAELKKPTATITPKVDDSDAQKGTQKIITSLRKLPKEQKVKLDADAQKAGIDDFTTLLKKVPKKTQTEILAEAQKDEVIDYESLLKKLPAKVLTDVELNDNASDELREIQKEAQNTESGFAHLKTVIAGSFIGGAVLSGIQSITDGLKDIVVEGASASDAMDKFKSTMQLGGFGAEEIQKTSDQVMDYANKTVYGLDDIANTTAQLAANGIKDYMGLTEAAGNLNAQAGGNAETFKSVAMMLTQTAGAGKLTTENWNQLADAIPGASGVLQQAMKDAGAYTGNFRDAMADGQITADEFSDALMKLGQTDGAKKAAESTATFEGAIGNLQAAVVDGMKNVIDAFGKDRVTAPINSFGTLVQNTFTGVTNAIKNSQKIIDAIAGVFSSVFGAIGNTLQMFAVSFKANVVGVINNKEMTQGVENFKKAFDNVMEAIKPIEQAIGGLLGVITGGAFSVAVDLIKGLASGFGLTGDEADKAKGKMGFSGVARVISAVSQALNAVLTFIKPVAQDFGEMAGIITQSAFSTFVDVITGIGKALGEAADAITPLLPSLDTANSSMSKISKHESALKGVGVALGSIATAFVAIKAAAAVSGVITAAAGALTILGSALDYVGAALLVFGDFVTANPLVIIVGAVIALGVAFYETYKHCEPFRDAVDAVWESIKKMASSVGSAVKNIYNAIVDGLSSAVSWIKKNWQGLALLLVNPIAGAVKLLYDNNKGFKEWADNVIKSITDTWKSATKTVSKVWQGIVDAVADVWSGLTKTLSKIWDGIKKAGEIAFKAIGMVILTPVLLVVGLIVTAWRAVHKPLETAWNAISKTASSVWKSISKATERAWNGIKDTVVGIAEAIYKPVKKAWDKVVDFISDLWNDLKKSASKVWGNIKDTIVNSAEAVYKPVHTAFSKVASWVSEKWDDIKKATSEKWGNVKDTVSSMSEKAKEYGSKYVELLKQDVGNKWDTVKSVTSKAWSAVRDYVDEKSSSAYQSGSKHFSNLRDKMSEVGDSISRKWSEIWNGISNVVSNIWKDIKKHVENGVNGVVEILNAGVDGIDKVWSFFTGGKTSIPHVGKVHFDQGGVVRRHLSVINDGVGPDWKELVQTPDGGLFMSHERNWTGFLPEGSRVYSGAETKEIMNAVGVTHYATGGIVGQKATHFADGGIVGDVIDWGKGALSNISSWIGDKIEAIEKFLKDPVKSVKSLVSKATEGMYDGLGNFSGFAKGAWDKITDNMKSWIEKTLNKVVEEEGGSNPPGEGVKRWESYVKKALEANGLPTTSAYVNAWLSQIQTESGGNPKAVQNGYVDVNTLTGDLAKGLLQTISSTFNAYKFPGHGDIFNGYDNMLAAIKYAKARYGSSMLSVIGHGHGYANGGHVYDKQLAWIAEDGDEFVINNRKPSADALLASAIKQRAEINPNSFSAKISNVIDGAKFSGSNGYNVGPSTGQMIGAANIVQNYAGADYSQQIESINKKLDIIADKQVRVDGRSFAVAYERYGSHERNQRSILGQRGLSVDVNF